MVLEGSVSEAPDFLFPLTEKYNIQCRPSSQTDEDVFIVEEGKLKFHSRSTGQKIELDLGRDLKKYRLQNIGRKKNPLLRALGLDKAEAGVVDGTLGFGRDFFMLLHFGVSLVGVERDIVPCFLTEFEYLRQQKESTVPSLAAEPQFFCENIEDFLGRGNLDGKVLYLDPIFESTSKGALPKKNMAFLRERLDSPFLSGRVFSQAEAAGIKRIVVKRPRKGQHLVREPSFEIVGKMIRFDVYRY